MNSSIELSYELAKELSVADIESEARKAWATALQNDPMLQQRLRAAGIEPVSGNFPFDFNSKPGAFGTTLLIMLAAAGIKLGQKAAMDIWEKIILPKLIAKYGHKALDQK